MREILVTDSFENKLSSIQFGIYDLPPEILVCILSLAIIEDIELLTNNFKLLSSVSKRFYYLVDTVLILNEELINIKLREYMHHEFPLIFTKPWLSIKTNFNVRANVKLLDLVFKTEQKLRCELSDPDSKISNWKNDYFGYDSYFKKTLDSTPEYIWNSSLSTYHCDDQNMLLRVFITLKRGAKVNFMDSDPKRLSPLSIVVASGYSSTVKLLLGLGANPNCKFSHSRSPLWFAIKNRYINSTKYLLEAGANPNEIFDDGSGYNGYSPLMCAENEIIVDLLINAGADVNFKSLVNNRTPLQQAVGLNRSLSIIRKLLNSGAEVNAADSLGNTALHYVGIGAYIGSEVVRLLLENGADVNIKNNEGLLPSLRLFR